MASPSNNPPLLEVKNLRVEFPTRRGTLLAVDDVSFDIAPGEVLGVVGESGAGKSLTGNAIIGLLEPPGRIAGGEIRLEGRRIDNLPYEEMRKVRGARIGAIFQDPLTSLNPLYRIGEQLIETITTHTNLSNNAARQKALSLLNEVGIPAPEMRIDAYPHQFSGGMRQRVVLALALAAVVVGDDYLAGAGNHDLVALGVAHVAHGRREAHRAGGLGLDVALHRGSRCGAADVEGPHRELRARLADGLRGDDADGETHLDKPAGRQIAAVALGADTAA